MKKTNETIEKLNKLETQYNNFKETGCEELALKTLDKSMDVILDNIDSNVEDYRELFERADRAHSRLCERHRAFYDSLLNIPYTDFFKFNDYIQKLAAEYKADGCQNKNLESDIKEILLDVLTCIGALNTNKWEDDFPTHCEVAENATAALNIVLKQMNEICDNFDMKRVDYYDQVLYLSIHHLVFDHDPYWIEINKQIEEEKNKPKD